MLPKLKVLFLCTGNSCRSQMAEGWARALHGDRLEPYSAGTAPGRVDPRAIQVMRDAGVDIYGQRSKHLQEFIGVDFDAVVTVCDNANESCPIFPGKVHRLHVGFDDPPRLAAAAANEDEALSRYRRFRDEIRTFVATLPHTLDATNLRKWPSPSRSRCSAPNPAQRSQRSSRSRRGPGDAVGVRLLQPDAALVPNARSRALRHDSLKETL